MATAAVVGVASGGLVAALGDASWGISVLCGLATAVLAVTIPLHIRGASAFRWPPGLLGAAPGAERQRATAGGLAVLVINWAVLVGLTDWHGPGHLVVRLAFLLMGVALYELGIISGALGRLGADDTGILLSQAGRPDPDCPRVRIFTGLPLAVGILAGVIMTATLVRFAGTPFLLAAGTGFAATACGLAVVVVARDRRLNFLGGVVERRYLGVVALAVALAVVPMNSGYIAVFSISPSPIRQNLIVSVGVALALMMFLAGFAAFLLGGIAGRLSQVGCREVDSTTRSLTGWTGPSAGDASDGD